MYIGLHVRYPWYLSDFNETWPFSNVFRKILQHQISRTSAQWEPSCSMRTDRRMDGRTDITKLIVAFRHFACLTVQFFSKSTQKHYVSWGAHSDIAEGSGILGCYAVSTDELARTFRREVGPSNRRTSATTQQCTSKKTQIFNSQTWLLPSIILFSKSVPVTKRAVSFKAQKIKSRREQ
jgi:hypothetical protein